MEISDPAMRASAKQFNFQGPVWSTLLWPQTYPAPLSWGCQRIAHTHTCKQKEWFPVHAPPQVVRPANGAFLKEAGISMLSPDFSLEWNLILAWERLLAISHERFSCELDRGWPTRSWSSNMYNTRLASPSSYEIFTTYKWQWKLKTTFQP